MSVSVRLTFSQPLQCEPVWACCPMGVRCRAGGGRQEKGPQAPLHIGHVSSCFRVACRQSADFIHTASIRLVDIVAETSNAESAQ